METTAKDTGSHFLVNGSKTWITNSPIADIFVAWAKNDQGKIRGYVLERDFGGIETPKIEGKMSLRASSTGMILMDDVKVPKSHELNVDGLKGPFSCLNNARFGISWGVIGAAENCFETARSYTLEREQFGRPLAATQLVQTKLANSNDAKCERTNTTTYDRNKMRLIDDSPITHVRANSQCCSKNRLTSGFRNQ